VVFFFYAGLGLDHAVLPRTLVSGPNYATLLHGCMTCPLLKMTTAAAMWFYRAEGSASCHCHCDFQNLPEGLGPGNSSTSFIVF
jgi:hypothetical protein